MTMSETPPAGRDWGNGRPELLKTTLELVGAISLPAAVLGVLAAFMGWLSTSAYLLTFGLGQDWLPGDVLGWILRAWPEIALLIALLASFGLGRVAMQRLTAELSAKTLHSVWAILLTLLAISGAAIIYRFLFRNRESGVLEYVIVDLPFVILWLGFVLLGEQISIHAPLDLAPVPKLTKPLLSTLFQVRGLYYSFSMLIVLVFLMNLGVHRAVHFALRDQSPSSRLSTISLISSFPLDIASGRPASSSTLSGQQYYLYDDLRLVARSEDQLFVFRLSESHPEAGVPQIYAVPMKNVELLRIRPWYWPTPTPTATPAPTSTPTPLPTQTP